MRQGGSVYKVVLADGRVRYVIMYREASGRQRKETVPPPPGKRDSRKEDAERLLTDRLKTLHDGTYRTIRPATFREYATPWLRARQHTLKPSTVAGYAAGLSGLVGHFGDRPLTSLTVTDVNQYPGDRAATRRPKTLRNQLALLHKILSDAVEDGYLARNPLAGSRALHRPRALREGDVQEIEILAPAEVNRLLDALPPEDYPLFLTSVSTGLRLGELLALQWGDVDEAGHRLHVRRTAYRGAFYVPKTKRSRRAVDVGDQLLAVLGRWRREHYGETPPPADALVFPSSTGAPRDPDNLRHRVWAPALAKAKLRHVRIQSLRHTFASMLIAQGENIKYISSQLGHASVQITIDRYGHLFPEEKRHAATRLEAQLTAARAVDAAVVEPAPINNVV